MEFAALSLITMEQLMLHGVRAGLFHVMSALYIALLQLLVTLSPFMCA